LGQGPLGRGRRWPFLFFIFTSALWSLPHRAEGKVKSKGEVKARGIKIRTGNKGKRGKGSEARAEGQRWQWGRSLWS